MRAAIYLMPKIAWDADAVAFLNAASITDAVIKKAVNNYVIGLKNKSLWTRIVALYPFVGGTATTHKYNLKDPQDTDAAFRMTFTGTITHDANGITTDGATGFGNTHVIPNTSLTLNDESLFVYSRTSSNNGTAIDMGASPSTTVRDLLQIRNTTDYFQTQLNATGTGGTLNATNTDGRGLYMGSRTSSTNLQNYKNGTSLNTSVVTNSGTLSTFKMYLGARNSGTASLFSARNYALAGCGLGFNSTQAADFYTLTQTFQTSLNRQV